MTPEEFFDKIQQNASHIPRFSWMPLSSKDCPKDRPATLATKFGGVNPWMAQGSEWPVCNECNDKKTFFCQVNFEDLPKEFQEYCGLSSGLFQLFLCPECAPFIVTTDVNIIPKEELALGTLKGLCAVVIASRGIGTEELPKTLKREVDQIKGIAKKAKRFKKENEEVNGQHSYEEFFVTHWKRNEKLEIPSNYSEMAELLEQFGVDEGTYHDIDDELSVYEEHKDLMVADRGVKLSGYICFMQDKAYPNCHVCGKSMTLTFLQLVPCKLLPFIWGEYGVGHVTLCPDCKVPSLGWAYG